MSAWYMFNCAGFYPVAPSSNIYNIGSPCVEALSIQDEQRKGNKDDHGKLVGENVYIKELYVNGKKYDKSYLTYEDVQAGITLHFVMSGKPNYKRAVSADARPASLSSPAKRCFTRYLIASKWTISIRFSDKSQYLCMKHLSLY